MMMFKTKGADVKPETLRAAMREAATKGFDPYESHTVQARILERRWKMEAGRAQRMKAR